jgi:hypothetical protein
MRPSGLVLSLLLAPSCKPADKPQVHACSPLPATSIGCVVHGPADSCPEPRDQSSVPPPPGLVPWDGVIVMPVGCCWVDTRSGNPTLMTCTEVDGGYVGYAGYGYR